MGNKGIALVSVLVAMVAVLMMALGMSYLAQANLSTGQHLAQQARARQLAEAGIDHALAYLGNHTPQGTVDLRGQGYEATLSPQGDGTYRVESTGTAGQARHTAVAILERATGQALSPFQNGFFAGGVVRVNNGEARLTGTRLHGDGGFTLNVPVRFCQGLGENCQAIADLPINQVIQRITGGLDATNCHTGSSYQPILCNVDPNNNVWDYTPRAKVCPIWRTATQNNDNRACFDSLTGRWTTVREAQGLQADELTQVGTYLQRHLGLRLEDDPYTHFKPARCDFTVDTSQSWLIETNLRTLLNTLASGTGTRTVCLEGNLWVNDSAGLVLPSGVRLFVRGSVWFNNGGLTVESGAGLYVSGDMAFNKPVSLTGGDLVASGHIYFNSGSGESFLTEGKVYGKAGVHFNGGGSFTDTKIFSGGNQSSLTVNANYTFRGKTLVAVNAGRGGGQGLYFNGQIQSQGGFAPLIVTNGDLVFNTAYSNPDATTYAIAGGDVFFNGGATLRGGVMAGGNITVNNAGLTLAPALEDNDDLPRVEATGVRVTWRR